jgi:chaperonin GroEL
MKTRQIATGTPARKRILEGALRLAQTTTITYGPHGRTCILDRNPELLTTRDGVTVARAIDLLDPVQNLGAQFLKEACIKVNNEVGDGTTTVAILTAEMLKRGHKIITAGIDPNQIVRGMNAARDQAISVIEDLAVSIETQKDIERVAMLASNGDTEVAQNMAEACMAVGKDGTVTIEDGQGIEVSLEFKEGMDLDRGPASMSFLKGDVERTLEGPLVAVINFTLQTLEDIQDLLEVASQWPQRELLVIAQDVKGVALATMIENDKQGIVRSVAVLAPGFTSRKADYLQDIAALSGATFVDPVAGYDIRTWDANWFGAFRKVLIKHNTVVLTSYDEARETLAQRILELKAQERHCVSDYDRDRLQERLGKLSGGMAVLRIGAATEAEMKERRARVEDALAAVKASLKDGVVPGAGLTYLRAAKGLGNCTGCDEGFTAGWNLVRDALSKPAEILATNGGHSGAAVLDLLQSSSEDWWGWDTLQGRCRDLIEDPPIIDPTAVALSVLRAAVSVASTLLTVEVSITEKNK